MMHWLAVSLFSSCLSLSVSEFTVRRTARPQDAALAGRISLV
jgi:hypothetical protein